ncbi:MarR family winged helix-turn-helix transcriptional regulator [Leucothrix pacifica]|uniref:HTH marR-type domain-containing protein n=1 Tax=Leucothrix pacifica TaxID=1247513 RepID=A0A317CMS5_9GAMM|nr:MarR family transcriptional regulator [Leucothrix pacifica]PWQ99836.1 hypothetical protein DKW60_05015 [Leucothrix pacifica]
MPTKPNRKPEIGISSIEADIFKQANQYSDETLAEINQLLMIWGMTALQHSALRVIYVHDKEDVGLPSGEIGKHLITRVPDVTRLLDRMAEKKWLIRERDKNNRRVVRTRLTKIGIELVESTHSSLVKLEQDRLAHMTDREKAELKRLLELAVNHQAD